MTKRHKPALAITDTSGNRYPFVLVEWVDSCYVAGWTMAEPNGEPSRIKSAGWLIKDSKKAIVVASHVGDEDRGEIQRSGEMTIPRGAIKRIRRIP